jgi:hypothetical protein
MEQPGQNRMVNVGEHRPADLTLKDQHLMPPDQHLHILLPLTRRQQAQQSQSIRGGSKVGQAQ